MSSPPVKKDLHHEPFTYPPRTGIHLGCERSQSRLLIILQILKIFRYSGEMRSFWINACAILFSTT